MRWWVKTRNFCCRLYFHSKRCNFVGGVCVFLHTKRKISFYKRYIFCRYLYFLFSGRGRKWYNIFVERSITQKKAKIETFNLQFMVSVFFFLFGAFLYVVRKIYFIYPEIWDVFARWRYAVGAFHRRVGETFISNVEQCFEFNFISNLLLVKLFSIPLMVTHERYTDLFNLIIRATIYNLWLWLSQN